jgi:hypothetical protein
MRLIHISWGGQDRRITDEAGKSWLFEDHPRFGPIVLNRRGEPASTQPGSRSPFWTAWQWWNQGGKKLNADGITCVWEKPAEPELVHLGGRNYALARSKLAQRCGKP